MEEGLFLSTIGLVVVGIVALMVLAWAVPIRLWIEAIFAGVRVGLGDLIGMRLRKVNPASVIRPLIAATKAELSLTTKDLEAHYLAGGRVDRVVKALLVQRIETDVDCDVQVRPPGFRARSESKR